MFSGGESTDSQKYTQWAMNPAAYQNAANDQVDWAALAQQWIIMKEAGPPPIPQDLNSRNVKPMMENEGGEAEMDVDNEKGDSISWNAPGPEAPPAPGAEAWANWNPPANQNWNWNATNNWNPPSAVPPPPGIGPIKTPLLPTPNNVYTGPLDGMSDNAVPYAAFNPGAPPPSNFNNTQPAFWTGMAVGKISQTEIKPHNKRFSKVNVPTKVTIISPNGESQADDPAVIPEITEVPAPVPTLDANKRKQLPAWIREGLEKMERDKMKQMEREKEKVVRDEITEKIELEEKEKMEILKTTIKEKNLLKKSRFDSDNENSDHDDKVKKRKVSPPPPVPLTPEELMMKVRKTMTEILLKVTNQLIEQTIKEERQRYIKKRRASDQLASAPSGALIRAKLGLGAYDDGSSSNDESDKEERRREANSDSDVELRDSIRKRQAAFSKTEQEIEDRLAEVDRKKARSRSGSSSRSPSADKDSQVEANPQDPKNHSEATSKAKGGLDERSTSSSEYESKPKRRTLSSSDSHESSREKNRSRSESRSRYSKSPRRRSRSLSSSRRDRRNRRSRSDSRYSKRSRRSRSRSRSSYSSKKSSKRSRRSSRSRSRSRDRKHHSSKKSSSSRSYESRSKRSNRRSRSRSSRRRSPSSSRSHKKSSKSHRDEGRSKRRSRSRSSSRGKRSYRR